MGKNAAVSGGSGVECVVIEILGDRQAGVICRKSVALVLSVRRR